MFKILSFLIGVVIAIMFLAPGLYFDVWFSIQGVKPGSSTGEQLGYGLGSMLFSGILIEKHLPYWIFAFVVSVIFAMVSSVSDKQIARTAEETKVEQVTEKVAEAVKVETKKSSNELLQELIFEVQQLRKELSK